VATGGAVSGIGASIRTKLGDDLVIGELEHRGAGGVGGGVP